MPRQLTAEVRAKLEKLLSTTEGKEILARNLNRAIRQHAADNETSVTALVADSMLPMVAQDRDGTIFLLTILADIAVEDQARQRSRDVH